MIRWRGWLAVFGGILVHITLGTIYSIGNISPYLISYLRRAQSQTTPVPPSGSELTYADSTWWFALAITAEISMSVGGLVEKKIGPRLTTLVGAWIMSLGVVLTGVAVEISFALTVVTYGVVFGFGLAIAYTPPLACAMKWMPDRKGLITGCVLGGFGFGSFIFDQVQTAYINPKNLSPDQPSPTDPNQRYFTQKELLDRVPNCFFLLGGIYAGVQLLGCLLLTYPSEEEEAEIARSLVIPLELDTVEDSSDRSPLLLAHIKDDERFSQIIESGGYSTYSNEESQQQRSPIDRHHSVNASSPLKGKDMHPFEMLKTKSFYYLWLILFFNSQIFIFVPTIYKAYGLTFIQDDNFLTWVGTFASVSNAVGRIFWGYLMDKTTFKTTMLILCTTMIALMMTLVITESAGKVMFFIWIFLLFGTFSGNFSMFPTVCSKIFGSQYILINYGILFTATVVTAPVGAVLSTSLYSVLGWFGLFCLMSAFMFAGLVLTYLFDDTVERTL